MEIRPANEGDIPGIVELLKVSLGESLMPKSERYWRWKHIENPFGVSPVLIAVAGNGIVGVRAFMRWRWTSRNSSVEAVRAVDTATHPDFQGKGIFSKLTKSMLAECEARGYHLVFNTPNKKSMPGYLKMGWARAGRYPVVIRPTRPLNMIRNIFAKPIAWQADVEKDNSVAAFLRHPGIDELLTRAKTLPTLTTAHSAASLRWRYDSVPVAHYYAGGTEENGRLRSVYFFRLKNTRYGLELRITDLFAETPGDVGKVRKLLADQAKVHGADYITFGGLSAMNPLRKAPYVSNSLLGPEVTIRQIGQSDIAAFEKFNNWSPSLGDLELF